MTIIIILLAMASGLLLVPRLLGYQTLAVLSGSMEPEIPVGGVVFVRETPPEELEVGDVVSFTIGNDMMATHRIIEIDRNVGTVTTQGDANEVADGAISMDRIVGRVGFHLPYLGFISINIATSTGIFWVSGTLIVLILLGFLPEIFKKEEIPEVIQES